MKTYNIEQRIANMTMGDEHLMEISEQAATREEKLERLAKYKQYQEDAKDLKIAFAKALNLNDMVSKAHDAIRGEGRCRIVYEGKEIDLFSLRAKLDQATRRAHDLMIQVAEKYNVKVNRDHHGSLIGFGEENCEVMMSAYGLLKNAHRLINKSARGELKDAPIVVITMLAAMAPYRQRELAEIVKQRSAEFEDTFSKGTEEERSKNVRDYAQLMQYSHNINKWAESISTAEERYFLNPEAL